MAANSGVQIRKPGLGTLDPADQSRTIAVIAGKVDLSPHHADRLAARERLAAEHRRLRHARMADKVMPMAVHYGPRPLLAVPLGELDARGRWVA